MEKRRQYNNYTEYLEHQSQKSLRPRTIRYLEKNFDKKVMVFKDRFKKISNNIFLNKKNVLCLGARMGEEVIALRELGFEAIGIDLIPNLPHVIEGDFNKLQFNSESFDIVYTNSFDHTYDIHIFLSQVYMVLKNDGIFILDVFLKNFQQWEVIYLDKVDDLISYMENNFSFKLIEINENLPMLYKKHRENRERQLIFKKYKGGGIK